MPITVKTHKQGDCHFSKLEANFQISHDRPLFSRKESVVDVTQYKLSQKHLFLSGCVGLCDLYSASYMLARLVSVMR